MGVNLISGSEFRKSYILAFAVVLGVIGLLALILTFAFDSANGDFEAESMTVMALPSPSPLPSGQISVPQTMQVDYVRVWQK